MTTPTYPDYAWAIASIPSRDWRKFLRGYVECMGWCGIVLTDDENESEYPTPDSLPEPYSPEVWAPARPRIDTPAGRRGVCCKGCHVAYQGGES